MSRQSPIISTTLGHRRQHRLFGLVIALFTVGAIILSIGLVGYFGRGQPPAPLDAAADHAPARPSSTGGFGYLPVAIPYYNPKGMVSEPELTAPVGVVIESIGVDAPVSTFGLDSNAVPTVPTGADAAEVVAWYDFSALPGAGSNAIFSGHVTWEGRAVFWALDQVQTGDTIRVQTEDGREFVYEVSANFVVDANDPDSLRVMAATATDTITIITCGGSWIPDPSDAMAGGSYTNRTVVQGRLVEPGVTVPARSTTGDG